MQPSCTMWTSWYTYIISSTSTQKKSPLLNLL